MAKWKELTYRNIGQNKLFTYVLAQINLQLPGE